jgi:hypothetical protein
MCTNAQHDPGGETKAPPSVWLEEESKVESSRHVEPTDVKMNDVDVEGHRDTQKEPRDPVGTTDGDERHPSVPTEPPNKEGAAKCLSGELRVKSTVERARESSRKVEGKRRSQSEGEDETSQQGNGKPTISTNSPGPLTPPTKHPERSTHDNRMQSEGERVERPQAKSTTTQPRGTPHDEGSSGGLDRGEASYHTHSILLLLSTMKYKLNKTKFKYISLI